MQTLTAVEIENILPMLGVSCQKRNSCPGNK